MPLDGETLVERMKIYRFEPGTELDIVLKEGARYLPTLTVPYQSERGWAPPMKDTNHAGVLSSGILIGYDGADPKKIYITPFWDAKAGEPAIERERYFLYEDAIFMVEDTRTGRRLFNRSP